MLLVDNTKIFISDPSPETAFTSISLCPRNELFKMNFAIHVSVTKNEPVIKNPVNLGVIVLETPS